MDLFLRRLGPLLVITGLVAGCGPGSDAATAPGVVRPAETAVPRGTSDPRVQPAIKAYQNFQAALIRSQRKPLAAPQDYPDAADFTRYSFEPVAVELEATIKRLSLAKAEFRGTPPVSHVTVVAIDPDATPWPMITLSDCQSGQAGWQAFDTGTDKPLPKQSPRIPRPYGATVTLIYNQLRWGVSTISVDPDRTCPD